MIPDNSEPLIREVGNREPLTYNQLHSFAKARSLGVDPPQRYLLFPQVRWTAGQQRNQSLNQRPIDLSKFWFSHVFLLALFSPSAFLRHGGFPFSFLLKHQPKQVSQSTHTHLGVSEGGNFPKTTVCFLLVSFQATHKCTSQGMRLNDFPCFELGPGGVAQPLRHRPLRPGVHDDSQRP